MWCFLSERDNRWYLRSEIRNRGTCKGGGKVTYHQYHNHHGNTILISVVFSVSFILDCVNKCDLGCFLLSWCLFMCVSMNKDI